MSDSPSRTATRRFATGSWLAGLAVLAFAALAPEPAAATQTITVYNTNDNGNSSLRDAIEFANNFAGTETVDITFNVQASSCPVTINLESPLPDLTADRIINIYGYSQPGSSSNTLEHGNNAVICVELSGQGFVERAVRVPQGSESNLTVYGLQLTQFDGPAIDLQGGVAHFIYGNRFGTDGESQEPNVYGVHVGAATGVRVGWGDPQLRNVFGASQVAAVLLQGSSVATVRNNYIGTTPNGDEAIPNLIGVVVTDGATDTVIEDNLISGNEGHGIVLLGADTAGTTIVGNRIGYKRQGVGGAVYLSNGGHGIRIDDGAHDNLIGGTFRDSRNAIGFNEGAGVFVQSGRGNRIMRNSTSSNGGLGIDLGVPGINPNDDDSAPQPPDSPNHELNFPVLTSAVGEPQNGVVTGTLTSIPGDYVIEFFATSTCGGGDREGRGYLGAIEVTIDQLNPPISIGTVDFSVAFTPDNPAGPCVIATASDVFGNTSEFSAGIGYGDVIFADGFE